MTSAFHLPGSGKKIKIGRAFLTGNLIEEGGEEGEEGEGEEEAEEEEEGGEGGGGGGGLANSNFSTPKSVLSGEEALG